MPVELGLHDPVVFGEELCPAPVSKLRGSLGRTDDVGEEHGCQDAIDVVRRPSSRDKRLNLVDHGIDVADRESVVNAGHLDELGARNEAGDYTTALGGEHGIPS